MNLKEQIKEIINNGIWENEEVNITTNKIHRLFKSKIIASYKEGIENAVNSINSDGKENITAEQYFQDNFKN